MDTFDDLSDFHMTHAKVDRRSARTRATLQHALYSLVQQKPYETITTDEICSEANVARSTFYVHFRGKDDLKRSGLEHLRAALAGQQQEITAAHSQVNKQPRLRFSLIVLRHARDHLAHYRSLSTGRGRTVALNCIRKILNDAVRDELRSTTLSDSKNPVLNDLAVQYVVGAFMSMLTSWLDGGAKLAPEHLDAAFRSLTLDGLRAHRLENRA